MRCEGMEAYLENNNKKETVECLSKEYVENIQTEDLLFYGKNCWNKTYCESCPLYEYPVAVYDDNCMSCSDVLTITLANKLEDKISK